MIKDKKILYAVIVIIVIAIIGAVLYFGVFATSDLGETSFSTEFMSGKFVGTVDEVNTTDEWAISYNDPNHHIEYNISTCDNASFLVQLYKLQGMKGPEVKNYDGQEWTIYHGQGTSGDNSSDKIINVYMCVANKDNQSYVLYIIFNNDTDADVDGTVYCEGYSTFIEPLLKSLDLKHNDNVPKLSEMLGVDEQTFAQQTYLLDQANRGNQTAIAMLFGG